MNKTELIKPVAEAAGISQTQAKAAIEKVFDTLVETLKNGENATLLGFGSFTVVERPERQGVNPKTGEKITQVANYGTGFAPYFIGLGMWVGCLMITFLIRAMNNRLLMSRASSISAVLSSYIPMASIAILQVMMLLAFVQFGLGLNVNFPLQYYLFGLLTALCFMAIAQFVRAAMGSSGLVVLVVLLMLQLCTAAGTFPIESELPVFNVLNPLLPMTYVVQGFRMAMCGLDPSYMASSAVVLGGFTLTFLVLSTLLAHHRRRISMSVLHPKIQMVH